MYATVALKLYKIPEARGAISDFLKAGATPGAPSLPGLVALLLAQADASAVLAAVSGAVESTTLTSSDAAVLADLALEANDAQRAERYTQQALSLDSRELTARRVLARVYVVRDDRQKALDTARDTMREDPAHAAFELAEVLIAMDRLEEAHQELERLRTQKVSDVDIDRRLALLAFEAGDMKEAQQRFTELASEGEANDATMLFLADIAARDGDTEAALAGYRRLADSSVAVSARARAASLLLARRDRKEALTLLDDYATDHPESELQLTLTKARLLAANGEPDTGLAMLDAALARHPAHPSIQYDRAVILEQAGRVHESVQALERLLQDRPDDPVLLNALGYTLADHGLELSRADGLVRRALVATPDSPAVLDSLGWVRFRQGDARDAVTTLERAYQLGRDAEIAAHWGEALWASGQHQEARKVWAAALAREPDSAPLKATIARFVPNGH